MNKITYSFFIMACLLSWVIPAYADEYPLLDKVKEKWIAQDFELKDEEGGTHKLSDYRGKVVVLNFWATWCPPCRYEMPSMERAHKKWSKEGIEIIAVNIADDEDKVFAFTGEYDISFTVLLDLDSSVYKSYPVVGLPTTYIIDPEGYVVFSAVGGRDWDDPSITEQLRRLKKVKH